MSKGFQNSIDQELDESGTWKLFNARHLNYRYGHEFIEGNTYSRCFIMQINYQLNVWEEAFYSSILPHSWKNLILLVALVTFGFKEF